MPFLIPTKTQWKQWSLPSKLTCVGAYVGVIALLLTVIFFVWPLSSTLQKNDRSEANVRVRQSPGAAVQTAVDSPNALQIGSLTINVSRQQYRPITLELRQAVEARLAAFSREYMAVAPTVLVECESGSNQRFRVGADLGEMLTKQNLGRFAATSVFVGRFPGYPITLRCGTNSLTMASAFLRAISSYVTGQVDVIAIPQWPDGQIGLYLNGEPFFSDNGAVTIE